MLTVPGPCELELAEDECRPSDGLTFGFAAPLAFNGKVRACAGPLEGWELLGLSDCVDSATFHQTPKKDAIHPHHWCSSANRISLMIFLLAEVPPRGAPGVRGVVPKFPDYGVGEGR